MKLVLLDDERYFKDITWVKYPKFDEIIIIRTYKSFVNFINSIDSLKDLLFTFDHDIQDFYNKPYSDHLYEYTGLDCVKYIIEVILNTNKFNINDFNYVVHSMNPIGKENIITYIENFKRVYE